MNIRYRFFICLSIMAFFNMSMTVYAIKPLFKVDYHFMQNLTGQPISKSETKKLLKSAAVAAYLKPHTIFPVPKPKKINLGASPFNKGDTLLVYTTRPKSGGISIHLEPAFSDLIGNEAANIRARFPAELLDLTPKPRPQALTPRATPTAPGHPPAKPKNTTRVHAGA